MIDWKPLVWNETSSADRARDLVAWSCATLRSKYGINFGIEYTHTQGVAELHDHDWYFGGDPARRSVRSTPRSLASRPERE